MDTDILNGIYALYKKTLPDENISTYNQFGDIYENHLVKTGMYIPDIAIGNYVESLQYSKDIKILDYGCGSGFIGKKLFSLGFTNIDGVDGSTTMLELAKQSGAYTNLFEMYLGTSDEIDEFKGKYDFVIANGMIVTNLIPTRGLLQMVSALSATSAVGAILFTSGDNSLNNEEFALSLEADIKRIEEMGMSLVKRFSFDKYDMEKVKDNKELTEIFLADFGGNAFHFVKNT